MVPIRVSLCDLVLAVTWAHLPDLGAELVVFAPELLGADSVEMTGTVLIVRSESVYARILVVMDMKGVNGKECVGNGGSVVGKESPEAGRSVNRIRAVCVVSKYEANTI